MKSVHLTHAGSYSCYWEVNVEERFSGNPLSESPFSGAQDKIIEMHKLMGQSNPSGEDGITVKNMTEDSSYADDMHNMITSTGNEWTESELNNKISSWN